jgi:uncharacterized membrane-anchored protein
MKIRKYKTEETLGIIVGVILTFIIAALIIETGILLNIFNQIFIWVIMGLAALMITIGHYIVSKNVIDEKTRNEDIIAIKGNLIGYFLWLILIIFATLLNIEIDPIVITVGGYATILLIIFYINKKKIKQKLFLQRQML